jgi:transposase
MRIKGCDWHARQQKLAMLDTTTGEVVKKTLPHEGYNVREFYSTLPGPVRVVIEAMGSMQWFVNLMEELGIESLVGHPAEIRVAEPRKQKHDRRDADLLSQTLRTGGPINKERFHSALIRKARTAQRTLPLAT